MKIIKCSIEIIQSFENLASYKGESKIESTISLDFGLTYNGSIIDSLEFDPMGQPVDRCARLNKIAEKNEIILSNPFYTRLKEKDSNIKNRYNMRKNFVMINGIGKISSYRFCAA